MFKKKTFKRLITTFSLNLTTRTVSPRLGFINKNAKSLSTGGSFSFCSRFETRTISQL